MATEKSHTVEGAGPLQSGAQREQSSRQHRPTRRRACESTNWHWPSLPLPLSRHK